MSKIAKDIMTPSPQCCSGETTLNDVANLMVEADCGEIPIYIEVLCQDRDKLVYFLGRHGIQTRPFYPDLNQAQYLKSECTFPNSTPFGAQGLFLPSGPDQPLENIDRVIEALHQYRKH